MDAPKIEVVDLPLKPRYAKILDAIMDKRTPNVSDNEAQQLLRALGFKIKQGKSSHQLWIHEDSGARFGFVLGKHREGLAGMMLDGLRKAMIDRGVCSQALNPRSRIDGNDNKHVHMLNKFIKSINETPKETEEDETPMSEWNNQVMVRLKQLEQYQITNNMTLKSIQELLMELGAKLDVLPDSNRVAELVASHSASLTSTIEELAESWGSSSGNAPAMPPKYKAIKEALEANPQFKDNPKVLAALANTTIRVVSDYLLKYPV